MSKSYAFFYFMKNDPDRIKEFVPSHVTYWKTNQLEGYKGGPFADRSGGLVSFQASNIDEAIEIIENDPFIQKGLIETKWIKEWLPE